MLNLRVFILALLANLTGLMIGSAHAADCSRSYSDATLFSTSELRLRSSPSTFGDSLMVLARGQRVEPRGSASGGWVRAHVPAANLSGYVATRYLSESCIEGEERTRASMPAEQIALILMAQSRASYSGNCPCPYNTDRAGRRCGGRSAYSRPGGASPLCYRSDVSAQAIERFRRG